ncbi:hypothetical protein ACSYDW_12330 [Paeniglutamicibacter sp. R2-26]|uniref:hypothetical protein n=1 Tax=Paeniglutamicibacter sp. R2-26 TaxID=3144417 RepID=UPI003EE489F1
MNSTDEKKWINDFTIELRVREVRGDAIGDAVASVKEFLADSGQAPLEAFGTPRQYADQLDLPLVEGAGLRPGATLAPTLAFLALLVNIPAVSALAGGTELGFSLPQLLLLLVPLLAVATLPFYLEKLVRRFWAPVVAWGICIVAAASSAFFAPTAGGVAWLSVDPLVAGVLSGLILLAASFWGMYETAHTPDDPIVAPLTSPRKSSSISNFLATVLPHALIPLVALGNTVATLASTR